MKYELPENLKLHYFSCFEKRKEVSYRVCKRLCPDTYRACWEKHLREDLALDCAIDNERKVQGRVVCSNCGGRCDIDLLFNRFMCDTCGFVESCGVEQQKEILGDAYITIDEQELSDAFKQIK